VAEIVVGVDGSAGGDAALRWALEEARLRGADLHVVHAFEQPPPPIGVTPIGPPGPVGEVTPDELADLRRSAAAAAQNVLDDALARTGAGEGGVSVHGSLVQADAATALVESARDAALLVVGSRGHGAVHELILGSVSHTCARTARCPVVVLPPAEREG
jgi:nucleotide-binding universal stress UspA family protein